MAQTKAEAAEEIRLIRRTLDSSQNSNFYKMKWELLILSLIVLFDLLFPRFNDITGFLDFHYPDWYAVYSDLLPHAFWSDIAVYRMYDILRSLLFGLLYGGLGVWCLIKRRRLSMGTVIRSELLIYDVWCWSMMLVPAVLKLLYALGDMTRIDYVDGVFTQYKANITLVALLERIGLEVVVFLLPVILTGIVLKQKWIAAVGGVLMTCLLALVQFGVNLFPDFYPVTITQYPHPINSDLYTFLVNASHPPILRMVFVLIKFLILLTIALYLIISSFVTRYKSRKAAGAEEAAEAARS